MCIYIYMCVCVCLCKYIHICICVSCVYTHPCRIYLWIYLNIRSSRGSKLFARGNNVKDFSGQLPTVFSHAGSYFCAQINSLSSLMSRDWEGYLIPHIAQVSSSLAAVSGNWIQHNLTSNFSSLHFRFQLKKNFIAIIKKPAMYPYFLLAWIRSIFMLSLFKFLQEKIYVHGFAFFSTGYTLYQLGMI